jgi:hypothetical protein
LLTLLQLVFVCRKNGLTRPDPSEAEQDDVLRNAIIEPVTALLNTGLAFIGPGAWTAGWFVIPMKLVSARGRLERRRQRARVSAS